MPKKLTASQKEQIDDLLMDEEGTPADESPGETIKKRLGLTDEDYAELVDEIEEYVVAFMNVLMQ